MIQDFANWLVYKMLEFTPHTQLGEAVNFFVYLSLIHISEPTRPY